MEGLRGDGIVLSMDPALIQTEENARVLFAYTAPRLA